MNLEEFYPTVLLSLGPPKLMKLENGTLTQRSYFEEFKKLAEAADVLGYKELRYPLTKAERDPRYRTLFDNFLWWVRNRD